MSWTGLVGVGMRARLHARIKALRDVDRWQRDTARVQIQTLRKLLSTAAETRFGRAHDFGKLCQLDDDSIVQAYRKAVPVRDWYGFKDDIAEMREAGRPDVLWPGLVRDFCQTSGTTAGDKFIPVSDAMFKSNYLSSLDAFAYASMGGLSLPGVFAGRALFLGGSSDVTTNEHGIRTGDLSGLVTRLIHWPISEVYLPGSEIALMDDWTAKIERMAERCIPEDVRFLSGMPSWALVLFQRVLEITGKPTVQDVWPNLRVFVHGGVRYQPFEPRMRKLFSGGERDIPMRVELYPASEAFVAIQDRPTITSVGETDAQPALRLNVDRSNVFEFVPLSEVDSDDPPAFMAHEVEPGERYVVTLSTCAGLWRYVLGDVVVFESVPAGLDGTGGTGPARLRIVGRHRHFMNAFGENIIVEHIENAVAEAARTTAVVVGEFTAAPVYPEPVPGQPSKPGRLQLAVELADGRLGESQLSAFGDAFDRAIKAQNVDYTTKRADGLGMAEPVVTPVPMGTFHRWMDRTGKLGGQHKCPRCANHRDIMDAVLAAGRGE
ncbi:MAG: GH3 auxin-responsive promoter family protein [Planctomycetota bacterium]